MRVSFKRAMVTTTVLASAGALGLGLLPSTAAALPTPPTPAEQHAAANALDAVREALSHRASPGAPGAPARDLTMLGTQLATHLDDLSASDRREALSLLARPSDPGGDVVGGATISYGSTTVQNDCGAGEPGAGTNFCVNWVASTANAPSSTDNNGTQDGDGIPDYVERVRTEMQNVWDTEVTDFGYKAPLNDNKGPNNKIDIYLAQIGNKGLYGYCFPESNVGSGWAYNGYCVLDNDYAEFGSTGNTPIENLQVTAAHEFFHAIQFAYDAAEDRWMMEGSAAWMEDEVYDDVNDNYQYILSSPISNPSRPLDHSASIGVYGSWIWWRFLSEYYSPGVVKAMWNRADDSNNPDGNKYSMKAVAAEIKSRGDDFAGIFSLFGAVNRAPETYYEEGAGYKQVKKTPAAKTFTLTKGTKSSGLKALRLNHMSNGTIAVKPGTGIGSSWTLKVNVDGPAASHSPYAWAAAFASNGELVTDKPVKLNSNGVGAVRMPFGDVARVDVTLTNAGHTYRNCFAANTQYSCLGKPADDDLKFNYKVTAVAP